MSFIEFIASQAPDYAEQITEAHAFLSMGRMPPDAGRFDALALALEYDDRLGLFEDILANTPRRSPQMAVN
jgi:hypothetical protein